MKMKDEVNNQLRKKKKKHCLVLTQDFSLSYLASLGHTHITKTKNKNNYLNCSCLELTQRCV